MIEDIFSLSEEFEVKIFKLKITLEIYYIYQEYVQKIILN